jgi:hypothetical protein
VITFCISTGAILQVADTSARQLGTGYSGNGACINDPMSTWVKDHGPLPVGRYVIHAPIDDARTGPFSLPLEPDPDNTMFDRGSFLVHGGLAGEPDDSPSVTPGTRTASDGCIVTCRAVREAIALDPDHILTVVAD